MGQALHALGIDNMSIEDRIDLVKDIWDSVAIEAGLLPPVQRKRLNWIVVSPKMTRILTTPSLGKQSKPKLKHAGSDNAPCHLPPASSN